MSDPRTIDSGTIDPGTIDVSKFDQIPIEAGPVESSPVESSPFDLSPNDLIPVDDDLIDAGSTDTDATDAGPAESSPDERLFARLRDWLAGVRSQSEMAAAALDSPSAAARGADFSAGEADFGSYRLVEEFTSLRHELKLQTKSSRGLEEQSAALLAELRQALDRLRSIEPKESQAAWLAGKALAAALADADEALERGRIQIERAARALIDKPNTALPPALDEFFARQSWLRRFLCRGYQRDVRALAAEHGRQERESLLGALLEGYKMIQNRLARAMSAERVVQIKTAGQPVDPELMVVVEVVEAPGKPPGVVVDEVRRGYIWNDRVLRCAEVRASMERNGEPARIPHEFVRDRTWT